VDVTVIIPTHNPHPERLRRTLEGLRAQEYPADRWECLLIDNASTEPVEAERFADEFPAALRVVHESELGLSSARKRGFHEAAGRLVIMVDDDNVLDRGYLANAWRRFEDHPKVGAAGGRSLPEFEEPPAPWVGEFNGLLALRDLGGEAMISQGLLDPDSGRKSYPRPAPIGAGMVLRADAARAWAAESGARKLSDRRGKALTSAGDNDIVLTIMEQGWEVAYFPELTLAHLIPAGRMTPGYLARLNRGIQKSWVEALRSHGIEPWPRVPEWSVPLRKLKAWAACRAWSGPAGRIRWQGACGRIEGCATTPTRQQ